MTNGTDTAKKFTQSNSFQPDLDWSQIRETVKMLHLAIAHVTASLHDGEESVENLSQSFTAMASDTFVVNEIVDNYKDRFDSSDLDALKDKCNNLTDQINAAIISFQFFDRFSQQLDHVCYSLSCLAEIVSDPNKIYHPYEWHALQNQIRSTYNMDIQREIFDDFMKGMSPEDVIEKMKQKSQEIQANDVEMF